MTLRTAVDRYGKASGGAASGTHADSVKVGLIAENGVIAA